MFSVDPALVNNADNKANIAGRKEVIVLIHNGDKVIRTNDLIIQRNILLYEQFSIAQDDNRVDSE